MREDQTFAAPDLFYIHTNTYKNDQSILQPLLCCDLTNGPHLHWQETPLMAVWEEL